METATIFQLADAAKVSRAWLAFGEGSMVDTAPEEEDEPRRTVVEAREVETG